MLMLPIDFSIDLHCHPNYKTVGKSYNKTKGVQSPDPDDNTSLWFYNPPSLNDKLLNYFSGFTKYSQTNLTAALYGRVWVMVVSLGSIEKCFFNNKLGTGFIADIIENFASGMGKLRIDALQHITDYYADLEMELQFLDDMNDKEVTIDGKKCRYRIVHNFSELEQLMQENEAGMNADDEKKAPVIIAIIPSIEGLHVLNCGLSTPCDAAAVKKNAAALKKQAHRPWFVTFSHHFYNELCGHCKSLRGFIAKKCDQIPGMGTGFTPLGIEVADILLDNTQGDRILIDIKHMSPLARKEFMEMRRTKYQDVPLIISHGACNGLPHSEARASEYPKLGNTFNTGEINFYDEEILEVVKSNGIIGLQLDERRIASEEKIKQTKNSLFRNKIMHYRSELLWNQVQYIAELLDDHHLFAWGHVAMGSDYDGIVDSLNSFWSFEEYKDLKSYLERHAHNYINSNAVHLKNAFNKIEADLIVQNLFQNNAWQFFKRWY